MSIHGGRRGFTLLEVLVGLVVGAIAFTAAATLLLGLVDRLQAVAAESIRTDRDANGERLIRSLVAAVERPSAEVPPLEGNDRSVRFESWCDAPDGWPARCSVRLGFVASGGSSAVVLETTTAPGPPGAASGADSPVEMWQGLGSGHLLYLVTARDGGRWVDRWSDRRLPIALGLVLDADTLVLAVGGRY